MTQQTLLPKYFFHTLIVGLVLLYLLEISGLDMILASWAYDSVTGGFVWKENALLVGTLHSGIKVVLWLGVVYPLATATLPERWRCRIPGLGRFPRQTSFALLGMLFIPIILVGVLKKNSLPYCPWSIIGLGGDQPHYEWWQVFTQTIAQKGKCWPAGHASGGFSLLAVYFFIRLHAPRYALHAVIFALIIGFVMGITQQIRGAHFMSHTLWTAWIVWVCCGGMTVLFKKYWRIQST